MNYLGLPLNEIEVINERVSTIETTLANIIDFAVYYVLNDKTGTIADSYTLTTIDERQLIGLPSRDGAIINQSEMYRQFDGAILFLYKGKYIVNVELRILPNSINENTIQFELVNTNRTDNTTVLEVFNLQTTTISTFLDPRTITASVVCTVPSDGSALYLGLTNKAGALNTFQITDINFSAFRIGG